MFAMPAGPERRLLRRREAEEQLGRVGDQRRAADARRHRHPLGQAGAAVEPAAHEPAADAGGLPEPQLRDQRVRALADCVQAVAAQQETASLASRMVASGSLGNGSASSITRTSRPAAFDARRSTGTCSAACFGTNRRRYGRPQATVMPSPAGVAGNDDRGRPARRQGAPRVGEVAGRTPQLERHHLVVQRRHQHLDVVVADDPSPSRMCCSAGRDDAHAGRAGAAVIWSTSS